MQRRKFLSAAAVGAAGVVIPASAARAAEAPFGFTATLSKGVYRPGEEMILTVVEDVVGRAIAVADSAGRSWVKRSDDGRIAVFVATAGSSPASTVEVTMTRSVDAATSTQALSYTVDAAAAAPGGRRWPGHQPGKVYLGQSGPNFLSAIGLLGSIGLRRTFHTWSTKSEDSTIRQDHAANRLPWVSYKPPGGASSWRAVADGRHDADIAERGRRYASYSKPVISTFHHEPTNDSGDGAAFAAAWTRIHDVMRREAGLDNVAFIPIIGDWDFNPVNRGGHPQDFLTDAVLERMPFLGTDCYQNTSGEGFDVRLERTLQWQSDNGVADPMIAIGETGCCRALSPRPEEWFNDQWRWVEQNSDRVAAMSYFNSTRNSKGGYIWSLSETPAKTEAYRVALRSNVVAHL